MAGKQSQFNTFIKKLASTDAHKQVNSFITDLYSQLNTVKAEYFKQEHREEFLRLRAQCRELINQTRGFCDKAIPSLEYAIAQYNSPNPVNVKELAENVLSRVDPNNVIEQCEKVENTIMTFNDRIAMDEHYKNTNIKAFLSVGFGAAFAITSLVGLFYAPVVVAAEIALAASGPLITSVLLPAIDLYCSGLNRIRSVQNFNLCKQSMIEASQYITQLKIELSNVTLHHGRLEVRLNEQDVHDLKPIYVDFLKNMNEIRKLCLEPFPMV